MKVVNPMETIMEGEMLQDPANNNEQKSPIHSNPMLKAESGLSSPVPIPHHSRRLYQNMRHHLSVSQQSMAESVACSHSHLDSSHRSVKQAASYLNYLRQNKSPVGSHPELSSSLQSPKIGNSPMPGRRTLRYERGFSVASGVDADNPCMSTSTTMHDVSTTPHEERNVPATLPIAIMKPWTDLKEPTSQTPTPVKGSVTFAEGLKGSPQSEVPPTPTAIVSQTEQNPVPLRTCTISMGSTDSCVVEFEAPDPNQCTVSSLTPLLGDSDNEKEKGDDNLA